MKQWNRKSNNSFYYLPEKYDKPKPPALPAQNWPDQVTEALWQQSKSSHKKNSSVNLLASTIREQILSNAHSLLRDNQLSQTQKKMVIHNALNKSVGKLVQSRQREQHQRLRKQFNQSVYLYKREEDKTRRLQDVRHDVLNNRLAPARFDESAVREKQGLVEQQEMEIQQLENKVLSLKRDLNVLKGRHSMMSQTNSKL